MSKIIKFRKNDWYLLKISLRKVKPSVWRSFTVPADITLPELHLIIQTVMGWYNSHLHQFIIDGRFYAEPDEYAFEITIDYRNIKLSQFITSENQVFKYDYDFSDGWEHEIKLEKILKQHVQEYPSCLEGERCCPPEDCGGPFGYMDMLKVISDKNNDEYEETMEWIGDDFDPEFFDVEEINKLLKEEDYGCPIIDDYEE